MGRPPENVNSMTNRLLLALLAGLSLLAPTAHAEEIDLLVVHRIKQEAFNNSHLMEYMHQLADLNGPRMAGSPGYRKAAETAVGLFNQAGIAKAAVEPWGEFGRGWDWSRVAVQMKTPQQTTLVALPADFSPGTDGPVSGEVLFAPLWTQARPEPENGDLVILAQRIEAWKKRYRGKLRGRIVMLEQPLEWRLPEGPETWRLAGEDFDRLGDDGYGQPLQPGPVPRKLQWPLVAEPVDKEQRSRLWNVMPLEVAADRWVLANKVRSRLFAALVEEGAAAVLIAGYGSRAGIIFQSDFGSHNEDDPLPPPTVALMPEQYGRIYRLLQRGERVELEVDVDAQLYPSQPGLNVIAELPGKGKELVMLGAHLDSWHGATGATDNAAGSVVVLEVMRILRALNLPMQRTVRAALWGEEEQCLCGSRGYVRNHFGDPVTMQLRADHSRLSGYFNLDNGSGKIRGVYLQQNDMARPLFEAWLAPFAELGVSATPIIDTTGTDHLSFNDVGLPAFQFVQDPLDYGVNTHHSMVDDVAHVSEGDLMQAVAVMATAVYHAAQRDSLMPRKPLPAPLPPKQELPEILRD
jgi:hypothetical protein